MNNGCFKIAYGYYIMFFLKIMDGWLLEVFHIVDGWFMDGVWMVYNGKSYEKY